MRTPRVCPMLSGGRASLWSAQRQAGAERSRLQRVESIQLHIYFLEVYRSITFAIVTRTATAQSIALET